MVTIRILLILTLFILPFTAKANSWVDDWLQQKTTTSPNYFSGQQRGYYTAGGFSARWPSTVDYPITVEMPRIKSGCGGIDVFLGGFSFLNADYLVDKLQSILENAPAVAFDLALKTLCEQCSNTIKNFEAMADKLNSMQIDECAASKELVGVVMDENGFHSTEVMRERLGTAIKENKLSQGVSEMWDILTKEDELNNNVPQPADIANITNGCNAEIKAVFLTGGSLLANVGSKLSIPSGYTDLIRGLVGDIQLSGPASAYRVTYTPPCSENNPDDLGAFATGTVYAKNSSGTCSQITDTNRDLTQYVTDTLTSIAQKFETKGTLSADEQSFVETNPLAPLPILKTAVATETEEATIASLAKLTAEAYALQMLSDLSQRAEIIAQKAKELLESTTGPSAGQPSESCQAVIFAQHTDQDLTRMLDSIRQLQESARESYVASSQELSTIMDYLKHMQQTEQQAIGELTNLYGEHLNPAQ